MQSIVAVTRLTNPDVVYLLQWRQTHSKHDLFLRAMWSYALVICLVR